MLIIVIIMSWSLVSLSVVSIGNPQLVMSCAISWISNFLLLFKSILMSQREDWWWENKIGLLFFKIEMDLEEQIVIILLALTDEIAEFFRCDLSKLTLLFKWMKSSTCNVNPYVWQPHLVVLLDVIYFSIFN